MVAGNGGSGEFRYYAFISYSHRDKPAAEWLHRALEAYRVPRRLVGRDAPLGKVGPRLYPIFRDTDELPSSADLSTNIREALAASRHLIVVCSPNAAGSRWVDEEVRHFKSLGRADRILGLIIDGEPNASLRPGAESRECFPPALCHAVEADGSLGDRRIEPLAADLRPEQDGRETARLKLVAGLTGLPFNELRRREHQRVVRRRIQIAAAIGLVAAGVGGVWFQGYRERRALAWEEARRQAVLIAEVAQSQAAAGDNRAAAALALSALPQSTDIVEKPFTRQAYAALHRALARDSEIARFTGHRATVLSIGFRPDGKRLVTGSGDKTARLWDTETGKTLAVLGPHQDIVTTAVFNATGTRILTSGDQAGYLWDAESGAPVARLSGHRRAVQKSAFSPDGRIAATAGWDNKVQLWDAATGRHLHTLTGDPSATNRSGDPVANAVLKAMANIFGGMGQIAFSPDSRLIAAAGAADPEGAIRIFDTQTGRRVALLRGHETGLAGGIDHVAFSPDGGRLVSAGRDGTARLWNASAALEMATLRGHTAAVGWAEFSPDGLRLVTASSDGTARLWDAATGQPLTILAGHTDAILRAGFSPDGRRVFTASGDNTVRVWNTATGALLAVLRGHRSLVTSFAFDRAGDRIATGSRDGVAILWDATLRERHVEYVLEDALRDIGSTLSPLPFVSPAGDRVVTGGSGAKLRLWDAESGGHIAILAASSDGGETVMFDRTGRVMLLVPSEDEPEVWDLWRGRRMARLPGARTMALAPDGRRAADVGRDGRARVWDTSTGEIVDEFALGLRDGELRTVSFAPDAPIVAVGGCGGAGACRLVLWNYAERRVVVSLNVAEGDVKGGDSWRASSALHLFALDGRRVIAMGRDRAPLLYATDSGREIAHLVPSGAVAPSRYSLDVDPSGRSIAVSDSEANEVVVWDAATGTRRFAVAGRLADFDGTGMLMLVARGWSFVVVNLATASERTPIEPPAAFRAEARFVPGNRRLILQGHDAAAALFDLERGQTVAVLRAEAKFAVDLMRESRRALEVSSDRKTIAGVGADGRARLWSVDDGRELAVFGGDRTEWVRFTPGSGRMLTGDSNGISLWDAKGTVKIALLRPASEIEAHRASANRGAKRHTFLAGGLIYVAAESERGIFDAASGVPVRDWDGHRLSRPSASDDPTLVFERGLSSLAAWDAATRRLRGRIEFGSDLDGYSAVEPVASPDGKRIVWFGKVPVLVDTRTMSKIADLTGHTRAARTAAFSRDGRWLATGAEDMTVRVWNAETGAFVFAIEGFAARLAGVMFSGDGEHLLAHDDRGRLKLWHVGRRVELASFGGDGQPLKAAGFDKSGRHFFFLSALARSAGLWRLPEPPAMPLPPGTSHLVTLADTADVAEHAAFSADGQRFLQASRDGTVRIYGIGGGKPLAVLRGHAGAVKHAAFDPEGRRVVTAGEDRTVRVFDAFSGGELALYNGLAGAAAQVAFTADGTGVVISGDNDPVRLWRFMPPHWPAMKSEADLPRYAERLLAAPAAAVSTATAPAHECDRVAADPAAVEKFAPGLRWNRLVPGPAIESCRAAVAQHPDVARFRVLYARGLLKAGEYHRALAILEELAGANRADALALLAFAYESGMGVERNAATAAELYERAANAGDVNGRHGFAVALLNGAGIGRDTARGLALLRRLAEEGLPQSQYYLGLAHLDGIGVAKAPALGLEWLAKAAAQDMPEADYMIGLVHWFGEGVPSDRAKGLEHIRRAAARGAAAAQHDLGVLTLRGEIGPVDPNRAGAYFNEAGQRGHVGAQLWLARAAANGVAKFWPESYFWYRLAASAGNRDAIQELEPLAAKLSEEARQAAETKAWLWRPKP